MKKKQSKDAKGAHCPRSQRLAGYFGGASGGGAFASVHTVCHALCVSLASFLATFGIIISDTALMFLQDYNIYFWLMGLGFLLIALALLIVGKPISRKLAVFNVGLLIASAPFLVAIEMTAALVGWSIALSVVLLYLKQKGVIP